MIIGVVGAGAIGTLVAVSLAAAGVTVRVLVRDDAARAAIAARGGLVLVDAAGADADADANVVTAGAAAFGAVEIVLVAVKSYATEAALAPLRKRLPHVAAVVSLQNGIAASEQIPRALGPVPLALAPTTEAATALGPGYARRVARGLTTLGWAAGWPGDPAVLAALAATFERAGLAARVAAPIEPHVWGKLAINAAINPLTALAGIPNGELLERPALRARTARIVREVDAVAAAAGIVLPFEDPVAAVEAVARATAGNRSSMLQDLERGGPTELDGILDAVVRRAAVAGVSVPEILEVADEVRKRAGA